METLLAIANLGQRAYGRWLFQRLLSGIIVVAGLVMVTAMMISALLVGGLYVSYITLLHYGVGSDMAMMVVALSAVLIIVMLVILTLSCLHHLHQIPKTLFKQALSPSHTSAVLCAFFDGFTTKT